MTALLVAATGGHLAQLHRLRDRFPLLRCQDVVWVTFDTSQSRSLLAGEEVRYVPLTAPRDVKHVMSNAWRARSLLNEVEPELVVSTGSGIALSFLPLAAQRGIPSHYIESAARSDGPSVTGRIVSQDRRIHLYSQHREWATTPWNYRGSVFDAWHGAGWPKPSEVRRIVVTLGTLEFPFRRLVERLVTILPPDVELVWQTGATDVSGLGIDAQPSMPSSELDAAIATADVVIAHAGCGSAISALEAGRTPLLVPRRRRFGEHVDDHQAQIARDLSQRGLAVAADASTLSWQDVVAASQHRACLTVPLAEFNLEGNDGTPVRGRTRRRFASPHGPKLGRDDGVVPHRP